MLVDELRGHGLVILVYEIKTYEKSVGFLVRYTCMKICTNENFPLYDNSYCKATISA